MSLTAVIIAKNAAGTLAKCLRSVSFADEVILVDSSSDDQTIDIAKQSGARVITNDWPGYGRQKNFGAKHVQSDWLLFIDADEEVTPQLQQKIRAITDPSHPDHSDVISVVGRHDFYWIRIVTIFLGHRLQHLFGHNLRLYKKSAGSWTDAEVHEQVQDATGHVINLGDNQSGLITEPITHHSHSSISSYLQTMHHYTTLDANQMKKTGLHRSGRPIKKSRLLPYQLASRQFIKLLLYRRGFLDGYAGFMWSLLSSYYEYEMAAKYLKKSKAS